jgi:hypothetical protein
MVVSDLAVVNQGLSLAGRGAGARAGEWVLNLIESADIVDDRLATDHTLRSVEVQQSMRVERHLLRPYDVLVAARSQSPKAAIVMPGVTRTVAASTLLVVRPHDPASGLGEFLWYYFSSGAGRAELSNRLTATSLPTLSAKALGEMPIRIPPAAELRQIADLIEAAERAYRRAVDAAESRRATVRDVIVAGIAQDRAEGAR